MYVNAYAILGSILSIISVVEAGSFCYGSSYNYYYSSYYYGFYNYCAFGCCGYYSYRYCCSAIGPIIGIIIGIVAFVVTLIIIVCCVRRRRATPGMVMQPMAYQNAGVTVVQSGGMQPGVMYPTAVGGYPTGTQPPSYGYYPQPVQQSMSVQPPPYTTSVTPNEISTDPYQQK